jgi:hypothetical protein
MLVFTFWYDRPALWFVALFLPSGTIHYRQISQLIVMISVGGFAMVTAAGCYDPVGRISQLPHVLLMYRGMPQVRFQAAVSVEVSLTSIASVFPV